MAKEWILNSAKVRCPVRDKILVEMGTTPQPPSRRDGIKV